MTGVQTCALPIFADHDDGVGRTHVFQTGKFHRFNLGAQFLQFHDRFLDDGHHLGIDAGVWIEEIMPGQPYNFAPDVLTEGQ